MRTIVFTALKALIVLGVLVLLPVQVVVAPVLAQELVRESMQLGHPRAGGEASAYALAALGIVGALCLQVVLVAIWPLLDQVRADRIFDGRARRWVDVIVVALVVAGLVASAGTVLAGSYPIGHFVVTAAIGVVAAACAGAALLMVVMRALLLRATTLQGEMDRVI